MDNEAPPNKRMRVHMRLQYWHHWHHNWWQCWGIRRSWWSYDRYQRCFMKIYAIRFSKSFRGVDMFAMRRIMLYLDMQHIINIDGGFYFDKNGLLIDVIDLT